jgi:regulator of replication initiation timing
VPDKSKVEAQQLKASFHSLQTQNELLYLKNNNLKRELTSKSKYKKKRYKIDLQHNEEYKGAGVF